MIEEESEEIGPEDGTIEMDRETMLRRMRERLSEPSDPETLKMEAVGEHSSATRTVQVSDELLRAAMDGDITFNDAQTLSVQLDANGEPATVNARPRRDTMPDSQTQPLGMVSGVEFLATIDDNGCIKLPPNLAKGEAFKAGTAVRVRIEPLE